MLGSAIITPNPEDNDLTLGLLLELIPLNAIVAILYILSIQLITELPATLKNIQLYNRPYVLNRMASR